MVRFNLKTKFFLFSLVLALIPITLLFLVLPGQIENRLSEVASNDLQSHSSQAAYLIESFFEDVITDMNFLAQSETIISEQKTDEQKLNKLRQFNNVEDNIYDDVTLIGIDGKVRASINHNYRGDWKTKEYFTRALSGEPAISDVHIIPDPSKVVVVLAVPVMNQTGDVISVLAVQLELNSIKKILEIVLPHTSESISVVNNKDRMIISGDEMHLLEDHNPNPEKCTRGIRTYARADGILVFESYTPLLSEMIYSGDGCWAVLAIQSEEEVLSLAKTVKIQIFFMMLVIFVLSLIFSRILANLVIHPITLLSRVVDDVKHGKKSEMPKKLSRDELGDLARSFDEMNREVLKSKNELESEVEKRTKQLNEKVQDLEKFNKLAVGRELKMIELKKKLKEMEERK